MNKVERVCKIKFPVEGEFCLREDLVRYVCIYKYNRVIRLNAGPLQTAALVGATHFNYLFLLCLGMIH